MLLLVSPPPLAQDLPIAVAWGDPQKIVFQGSTPFTEKQLRWAIVGDLDIQLAGVPSAPFQAYLDLLDRRLRAGFRKAGFRRPSVPVKPDLANDKIIIVLDPDACKNSAIVVDGASTIPIDQLKRRLTEPTTQPFFESKVENDSITMTMNAGAKASDDALWNIDDYTPFDDDFERHLAAPIKQALAELGYFAAQFDAKITADGEKATLNIHIIDEGPKAMIDQIAVNGTSRNSSQSVIDYLKVKPGDTLDLVRLGELQQRL